MINCIVHLKDQFDPIFIKCYIGHKIRRKGYSEFYGLFRSYYIRDEDILYISIDNEKGEIINAEET